MRTLFIADIQLIDMAEGCLRSIANSNDGRKIFRIHIRDAPIVLSTKSIDSLSSDCSPHSNITNLHAQSNKQTSIQIVDSTRADVTLIEPSTIPHPFASQKGDGNAIASYCNSKQWMYTTKSAVPAESTIRQPAPSAAQRTDYKVRNCETTPSFAKEEKICEEIFSKQLFGIHWI